MDEGIIKLTEPTRPLPKPLLYVSVTSAICTIISWAYALINTLRGRPFIYRWPYYYVAPTPELPHGDRFGDLILFADRFKHFHSPAFLQSSSSPPFPYPSPVSLVYRLFMPTFARPEWAFLALMVLFLAIAGGIFVRHLRRYGLSTGTAIGFTVANILLSEVMLFEARQANAELFIFILMSASLFLYFNRRFHWSAVLLGIAIAMKLYPFIMLGLFFAAKRYKSMVVSMIAVVVATAISLWVETGNVLLSLRGTSAGMRWFTRTFAVRVDQAVGWDHSIFGFFKRFIHGPANLHLEGAMRIYLIVAATAALVIYFARIRKLPVFNQVASLTAISILIPPVSFEYTLLHLYSVFALFCCILLRKNRAVSEQRPIVWMGIFFGFLFSIQGLFLYHGRILEGQAKCLVLLALAALFLLVPIPDYEIDSTGDNSVSPVMESEVPAPQC